jgi:hypothetical protein
MMKTLRWAVAPLLALLFALVIACGGDNNGGSSNGSGATNGGTTSGGSTTGGSGGSVSTELDLTNAATKLLEMRSFRFDMSMKMDFDLGDLDEDDEFSAAFAELFLLLLSDIKMSGVYVAPDSYDITMTIAGQRVRYVQIGNQAWVNEGSGWTETTVDSGLDFFGNPSDFAFDMLPNEVLRNAKTSKEKVNGIDTVRYSFDKPALEQIARDLGEDAFALEEVEKAALDVWVADGNIPVKVTMDMKGTSPEGGAMSLNLQFSVSDLNSSSLKVEKPN